MPLYEMTSTDQADATRRHPASVAVLQDLQAKLHAHQIYPSIAYDKGLPRLVISVDVTAWVSDGGAVICWGPQYMEEPAEHALTDDLEAIALRIVERIIEREAVPAAP